MLYDRRFTLCTDHKPQLAIFGAKKMHSYSYRKSLASLGNGITYIRFWNQVRTHSFGHADKTTRCQSVWWGCGDITSRGRFRCKTSFQWVIFGLASNVLQDAEGKQTRSWGSTYNRPPKCRMASKHHRWLSYAVLLTKNILTTVYDWLMQSNGILILKSLQLSTKGAT